MFELHPRLAADTLPWVILSCLSYLFTTTLTTLGLFWCRKSPINGNLPFVRARANSIDG